MKRIFIIVIAVMCLAACMIPCVFAAEDYVTEPGTVMTLGQIIHLQKGVTYTFTADQSAAKLLQYTKSYGWVDYKNFPSSLTLTVTGTDMDVKIGSSDPGGHGDVHVTVTWEKPPEPPPPPGFMDYVSLVATAIWSQVATVGTTIVETPILLFTTGFLFVGGCVAIFGRLLRKD